jgi:hypothetical protein
MCQCSPPSTHPVRHDTRSSVHQSGKQEAQCFKWIESQKAGRDLGEWAIRSWVRQHWRGFLRERWLQHLHGRHYWIELDHDDFGLLDRAFQGSRLIHDIVRLLREGHENLEIVNWAIDNHLSRAEVEEVLEILEVLHINSRRLEFQLDERLSQAG